MMDCNKINLKRGSKGTKVTELQTLLQKLGYYNGKTDGDYGTLTEQAIKKYQKNNGLLTDGIVGPKTCNKLQEQNTKTTTTNTTKNYTTYTNTKLCTTQKPDCLGQITPYHCGPHSIRQALRRLGITKYTEKQIGQMAGTTSKGTGHQGLETAIAKISKETGIQLHVQWRNFNELGNTSRERWNKYGDLMTDPDKAVFHHELYRNKYGHYSILRQVNTDNMTLTVANSLGNRSGNGYKGYMESRKTTTQESYLRGISQKSICIITKEA